MPYKWHYFGQVKHELQAENIRHHDLIKCILIVVSLKDSTRHFKVLCLFYLSLLDFDTYLSYTFVLIEIFESCFITVYMIKISFSYL